QRPEIGGQGIDIDAEVGRTGAVDGNLQFRLRRLEVRVDVNDAVDRANLFNELGRVYLELLDLRTLNENLQTVGTAAPTTAALIIPPRPPAHATGRGARNSAPPVAGPPRPLVLAELRATPPHHLLLRDIALFERCHRDVEVGVAGTDELLDATQMGERQNLLF